MKRAFIALIASCSLVGSLAVASSAEAYCRTTSEPINPAFTGKCWDKGFPLFWRNSCISFDLQKDAGAGLTYAQVNPLVVSAFATWSGATCAEGGNPSLKVSDLGPVECAQATYDSKGPNQHVILFRQDNWPYKSGASTLALTTVSFDATSGEIFDVDMEINAFDHKPVFEVASRDTEFDLATVVLHESGHFLGLAHSDLKSASMYASYTGRKRDLVADDVAGICASFPPNGTRIVSTDVAASGVINADACDATPRHGFASKCDGSSESTGCSCDVAGSSTGSTRGVASLSLLLLGSALAWRRRVRTG